MITNSLRIKLLAFVEWLHKKQKNHECYSRNDPEWIESDNKAELLKRQLREQIKR